jgi:predicted kinase
MPGTLIFFCGKMAAGKSTLARQLAAGERTVLLVQDELLAQLYPGEILEMRDFMDRSQRLHAALTPPIVGMLTAGVSVVLDFPANTLNQRAWFRELIERSGAPHEMHVIEASDALCKRQLRERSRHLPPGSPWTNDEDFDAVTAYFQPPTADEGFTIVRHARD